MYTQWKVAQRLEPMEQSASARVWRNARRLAATAAFLLGIVLAVRGELLSVARWGKMGTKNPPNPTRSDIIEGGRKRVSYTFYTKKNVSHTSSSLSGSV